MKKDQPPRAHFREGVERVVLRRALLARWGADMLSVLPVSVVCQDEC